MVRNLIPFPLYFFLQRKKVSGETVRNQHLTESRLEFQLAEIEFYLGNKDFLLLLVPRPFRLISIFF